MRVVLQRVSEASVSVEDNMVGEIGKGYLALVGFGLDDTEKDIEAMVNKIVHLRIFPDENHKLNLSILDIGGEILVVSQFTLYADCRKGRRPSFTEASPPERGAELFNRFVDLLKASPVKNVKTGIFQAIMQVKLINEGPVTVILDSKDLLKNNQKDN